MSGDLEERADWPNGHVSVYSNALHPTLLQEVLETAEHLAACPNYWTSKSLCIDGGSERLPVERAIQELYNSCMKERLGEDFSGAEWWIQVYEPGRGLAFHFDKDEALFKDNQEMRHPIWSSVLYLTGAERNTFLGPTVIINQAFDNRLKCPLPEQPSQCVLVWPQKSAFAVFSGQLAHGVLDSASGEKRVTLLINWWSAQPKAVDLPNGRSGVSPIPCCQGKNVTEIAGGSHLVEEKTCTLLSHIKSIKIKDQQAADQHVASSIIRTPHSQEHLDYEPNPREQQIEDLVVIGGKNGDEIVTVDELLAARHLDDSGLVAISLHHNGFQLCPIDADDKEQIKRLNTAAALVPAHLLSD